MPARPRRTTKAREASRPRRALVVTSDGQTLPSPRSVSGKIGIFDAEQLAADTFVPEMSRQIAVSGGGAHRAGAWTKRAGGCKAFTRFDNSISVIDTTRALRSRTSLTAPEPPDVIVGRRFLRRLVELEPRRFLMCQLSCLRRCRQPSHGIWEIQMQW